MVSQRLTDALNEQMNYEFASAHYYLGMAGYCSEEGLDGFTNFFMEQYKEELFHAMKFYNYIVERGLRIRIDALPAPQNFFNSPLDVFQEALKHEESVTARIYNLMDIAHDEKEYATVHFLNWFVEEQMEEEGHMQEHITKLQRIQGDNSALYQMDNLLAQRVFVEPASEE